jgi:hypothetical protein
MPEEDVQRRHTLIRAVVRSVGNEPVHTWAINALANEITRDPAQHAFAVHRLREFVHDQNLNAQTFAELRTILSVTAEVALQIDQVLSGRGLQTDADGNLVVLQPALVVADVQPEAAAASEADTPPATEETAAPGGTEPVQTPVLHRTPNSWGPAVGGVAERAQAGTQSAAATNTPSTTSPATSSSTMTNAPAGGNTALNTPDGTHHDDKHEHHPVLSYASGSYQAPLKTRDGLGGSYAHGYLSALFGKPKDDGHGHGHEDPHAAKKEEKQPEAKKDEPEKKEEKKEDKDKKKAA